MKGKILGAGVIRGKDDKRYTFDTNELQNAQGRDIDELVGSEVDFEVADGEAVSIYITESKSVQKPISPQIQEIKNKALASIALRIFGVLGLCMIVEFGHFRYSILFLDFGILGVMFVSFLVLCATINLVQRYSNSDTLLKNLIIAEIAGFVVGVMTIIHGIATGLLCSIVAVVALIVSIFYNYRYFKELAQSTQQPLFLYAFWCGVTLFLIPVAAVLCLVAWVRTKEIRKSYTAVG